MTTPYWDPPQPWAGGPATEQMANLSKTVKRALRGSLRVAGFEVSRAAARLDTLSALAILLDKHEVSVLLDVGAHTGDFALEVRRRGFAGRIFSYEPQARAFEDLVRRARGDALWQATRVALGDARRLTSLHIAGNEVSSSLLQMEPGHLAALPSSAYVATQQVREERLDDVTHATVAPSDFIAMKLDVQGYEEAVLKGATRTLSQTLVIHIELSLAPVYKGQPDWRTLTDALQGVGFRLYTLAPAFWDPATGQTLQIDALFARDRRDLPRPTSGGSDAP